MPERRCRRYRDEFGANVLWRGTVDGVERTIAWELEVDATARGSFLAKICGGLAHLLPFSSPLPFPFPFLPLVIGLLNTARGSGADPQRKSNFDHFSLKIRRMVASDLLIFLKINWPRCVKSTAKLGGGVATNWSGLCPAPARRGTATGNDRSRRSAA